jgi:hypothetical protein
VDEYALPAITVPGRVRGRSHGAQVIIAFFRRRHFLGKLIRRFPGRMLLPALIT